MKRARHLLACLPLALAAAGGDPASAQTLVASSDTHLRARATGGIQLDVPEDIKAFLAGTANDGRAIKKASERESGELDHDEDAVSPAVRVTAPDPPVVFNNVTPTIAVAYADHGTGVDLATLHVLVDGADVVAGCTKGATATTCAPPALSAGGHEVQVQISDHAGNVGSASYQFQIFLGAGLHTPTLDAAADTYLKENAPNRNQGLETILRVRGPRNNPDRALVRFDQAQMAALIGSQRLVSATLELYVEKNGNNWGSSGRTVDAHRITVHWAEARATWNCASDSDLSNSHPDCPVEWNGGSYASPATASVLQTRGLLGRVQWDVSRDVAAFLSGTPSYGWLIKKTDEAQPGLVEYSSREGEPGQRPRLVLVVKASAPIVTVAGVTDGQASNTDLTITYSATGDTALTINATLTKDGQAAGSFASGTTLGEEGAYALTVTASDLAGNQTTATRSFVIDKTPPTITVSQTPPPNADGWNNGDVTVSFSCADALSGVVACSSPVIVTQERGGQVVTGTATDRAGNRALTFATVSLDKTPPTVSITSPVEGTFQRVGRVQVSGTVADANPITSLSVNGTTFDPGTSFSGDVVLQAGAQSLIATAQDVAGNIGTASVSVTYQPQPVVKITSPANLAAVGTSPITVSGTVDNPAATVTVGVERVPAVVSGTSFTATGVHLQEGGNVLTAVATDGQGGVGTDSITVVLDTLAPRVLIDSPVNGAVTAAASIAVSGRVNDVVLGTINSGQAQVTVNGTPASVSNRTFVAQGVALQEGTNTITAVALDAVGNFDTKTITVVRQAFTALSLTAVSGDQQQAGIGETLGAPLVVEVKDAGGNPVPGRSLTFRVLENSGDIADASGHRGRALALTTDAQGRGQVQFTLGSRAGVGNNRVEVNLVPLVTDAVLTVPPVVFIASAVSHAPAKINLDSGRGQKGIVGQALPRPFVAVVTDEGHNRLGNVPVTFTLVEGGGNLAGAASVTVDTDSDGRALTVLTLGPDPGIENNTVTASVADLSGLPAVFKASAFEPGDPASTRISGVVLDNSNLPIPGVTLRLRGTALASATDDQGSFTLNGVPVGDVHLVVDGSTAQRPGTWPDLEFEIVTVPGANNTLGMPIYLLPLDTGHGIFVDETHGGTVTLPDYPGFSLTVAPNSATFPDGTRRGTVSVTVVHADKVPMVPNFGQQPRFIVTIQPPGARFDPPARVTHPNVDGLPPGHVTELYSFDHDMGSFVATGTATVSEDGTQLVSDPGTGIIKGGWHCGGDPAAAGTAADCPACEICDGARCVGPARCTGCDPTQIDKVRKAAKGLCADMLKPQCAAALQRWGLIPCFANLCSGTPVEFRCSPPDPPNCGATRSKSGPVFVYQDAFDPSQCGPLQATMAHELSHVCILRGQAPGPDCHFNDPLCLSEWATITRNRVEDLERNCGGQ